MDTIALFMGRAVLLAGAVGLLSLFFTIVLEHVWKSAKYGKMIRDIFWHKYYCDKEHKVRKVEARE